MPKEEKVVVKAESEAKKAFRELIQRYAERNPVKYEEKKDELTKQLSQIK
jgi:hypothetical protein